MEVSIFKNSASMKIEVEFSKVVEAIKFGTHQELQFSPSGKIGISGRRKNTLIYTKLVLLTFDTGSNEELENLFHRITEMSTTYCCFRNHLRNGLNVLVKTDCSDGYHKIGYRQVVKAYQEHLGLEVSNHQPDEYILCHLSYDPDICFNSGSRVFEVDLGTKKKDAFALIDESYKEKFYELIEYTNKIVLYNDDSDNFIYTLAYNCASEGIPVLKTLEFILYEYGLNIQMKGRVFRAYKELKIKNEFNAAFSIYFNNLRNYKEDVPLDKRVMFEFFIITYIEYEGQLNFSEGQFRQQLGIYYSRKKIIDEFMAKGFLYKGKISIQVENKRVPKNAFWINPDKVPELAKEYMIDSKKFVDAVKQHLKRAQADQRGYSMSSFEE